MQQDKHIITKLQQLENQQLPDLSQMDSHWQQMQALLLPAATQRTKSRPWLWLITAAVLLIVSFLLLNRTNNGPSAVSSLANTSPSPRSVSPLTLTDTFVPGIWTTRGDTFKLIQQPSTALANAKRHKVINTGNIDDVVIPSKPDTQYFNINFIPCVDSNATDTKAGNLRQQWLNELFAQLKKEPNQFVIDNRKDTTLFCQEGSALQIPAGSLGGNASVLFTVKEIYKKSDMVLNQLSATSNKALLESGGMLQLTATVNDQPVDIAPNKPITVYMADTGNMQQMQLFTGEKTTERLPSAIVHFNEKMEDVTAGAASTYMNWVPQYKIFAKQEPILDVFVLELDDEAADVKENRKGLKAVFYRSPDSKLSKAELWHLLKERHGDKYYKIKVKKSRAHNLFGIKRKTYIGWDIGDSIWVSKQEADRNRWAYTQTQSTTKMVWEFPKTDTVTVAKMDKALRSIDNKYGVNINRLGWINCDRFYNANGEKMDYVVQLGDDAANYYTLLVFNNINSVMNGYISGNTAIFPNVPQGMDVTVVSVGINNKGQAVYAMQKAITNKAGLTGITFQPVESAALPNALSKLDR